MDTLMVSNIYILNFCVAISNIYSRKKYPGKITFVYLTGENKILYDG